MRYELDRLGWVDFEELVQVLLSSKLAMGVEAWGGVGDWGRDAYCPSALKYPSMESTKGPFLFQCKFVASANAAGARPGPSLVRAVERESKRIEERTRAKKWSTPAHYALISNAPFTADLRKRLTTALSRLMPCTEIHLHSGSDVSNWLSSSPSIAVRFPQIFTIGDLNDLLKNTVTGDILFRSKTAVDMAREEANVFVPTSTYFRAHQVLNKHHFAVLEGPPEMGKTTIARMVALAKMTNGWEAIECKTPKEFERMYDQTKKQVFVADDFFGRTTYEVDRVTAWQDELPFILRQLNSDHWFILTSRAHLLKMAKGDLDVAGQNSRFPKMGEVVVDAGKLSELERAKSLYRHAKQARLSAALKKEVIKSVLQIIKHKHFTPLRIKNLVAALKTQDI